MTRATIRLLCLAVPVALTLLFLPGFVRNGLGQSFMNPQYSTYTSLTTDGTYIYTSVTVSGTTTGQCPGGYYCGNVTHQPKAYNVIGGVGGWTYGNTVFWNQYLSLTNNQQIAATPGTEYTYASSSEVDCSAVGRLYSGGGISGYLSFAITTVQTVSDNFSGFCKTQADCLGGVTPRCLVNPVVDGKPCAPGFKCYSIAYRFSLSSPFSCTVALCNETPELPGPCTQ